LAEYPTSLEILDNIDKNLLVDQAVTEATMTIHARAGTRTITSRHWTHGQDKAFVEYISPPREKGKKMLRLGDKLWTYTPEPTDRIITISGHLLRQSVMGSDLSYEDITENVSLIDQYEGTIEGEEVYAERNCYIVKLTAKVKKVTYHSRKIWVDTERWLPLKQEWFAKSGKLLKLVTIDEVFQVDERWYPKIMTFKDVLSRGKGTKYTIESIDFNVDIPAHKFTKAALRK